MVKYLTSIKKKKGIIMRTEIIKKQFWMAVVVMVIIFIPFSLLAQQGEQRTEEIYSVLPARSLNNLYQGITLPQNPGLAINNWSSAHQDSYCSESVGLSGPVSNRLKYIKQHNPYGFTPIMACNSVNQMIGVSFSKLDRAYRLIVFDEDLHILSSNKTAKSIPGSFGGGYFYLNNEDNAVVGRINKIACYPTANVEAKSEVYELSPIWTSQNIVEMITGSSAGNSIYSTMPVWDDENPNLYWCLLSGSYDPTPPGKLNSHAYIAVVKIAPDRGKPDGCTTTLIDAMPLINQWNNNTLAVDEENAYFVTNGLNPDGVCNEGYLYSVAFDKQTGKIVVKWKYSYENSGILNPGMGNIGSGTTPTLMDDSKGNKLVSIGDNAYPRMNVIVVNCDDGSLVSQTPVFSEMRSADEASLIGVNNRIVAENNFGHIWIPGSSQNVENEPGMTMIQIYPSNTSNPAETIWEDKKTCFFGMSMLCRESGIIFSYTGDWYDDISATEGALHYVSAIDSWNGRTIWRIPVGRGEPNTHHYGGLYFDRKGDLYVGAMDYLVSIKNN